jgi:phosphatidylserine decarboxylase
MTVTSLVAATSLRALPRKRLSRFLGQLARVEAPNQVLSALMRAYCRAYEVDLADYVVPSGGFETFDAFFTRRLKPGARAIDSDLNAIVSPADGRIDDLGVIESGATFRVKGRAYDVAELLGDAGAGAEFVGGLFAVVYLSPRDYHRVHSPISGPVSAVRHIPGTLFPVNSIGVRHVPKLLARNERVAVHQRSATHGRVTTVLVGAVGVGRISLSFDDSVITNNGAASGLRVYGEDPPALERGGELGVFHLGSTVVLLIAPGEPIAFTVPAGARVHMGEAIARKGRR